MMLYGVRIKRFWIIKCGKDNGMRFPPDFIYFVTSVAGSVDVSWSIMTKEWWESCKSLKLSKPVVYFSHDASYDGFPQLAPSFEDYIGALLKIGLVGNELWGTEPFVNEKKGGIDPECEAALEWRNFFGLM